LVDNDILLVSWANPEIANSLLVVIALVAQELWQAALSTACWIVIGFISGSVSHDYDQKK